MATSPLRRTILSCLKKDTGVDRNTLLAMVSKKINGLRYHTFMHMTYLLKVDSKIVQVKKLFYLAPEGYVYKKKNKKRLKRSTGNILDYRDFAHGEYAFYNY